MLTVCACLLLVGQPDQDWQKQESAHLKNIRQVTHDFVRAGEGYFSPDGKKIIFQAEEKGDNPFYQMFVMDLKTGATRRVSPGVGKTTCGFFRPEATRSSSPAAISIPTPRSTTKSNARLREEEKNRETPPLRLGLRSVHGHLRSRIRRHRPQAPDQRQGLRRRGLLFAPTASRSSSAPTAPAKKISNSTSWTPTARTFAS